MPEGFLRSWVATHVKTVIGVERSTEAKRLAAHCTADAMMAGVPVDQLDAAAGGNLVAYMAEAIDAADTAEVDRMLQLVRPQDAKRTEGPQESG